MFFSLKPAAAFATICYIITVRNNTIVFFYIIGFMLKSVIIKTNNQYSENKIFNAVFNNSIS